MPFKSPDLSVRGMLVPALLLGAAVLGIWLLDMLETRALSAQRQEFETRATALADSIAASVAPAVAMADALAANPETARALAESDLDAAALALKPADPALLGLRLVRRGALTTAPEAKPPFTYAALELVMKAEREPRPPGAEILFAGTPDEHLAIARKVPPDGETVGFIFLSFAPAALRADLEAQVTGFAAVPVRLAQPLPGAPPLVLAEGGQKTAEQTPDRAAGADTVPIVRAVTGTTWTLTLEPPVPGARLAAMKVPLLVILGAFVLILAGWRVRTAQRRGAPSPTVYQGAIGGVMRGELPSIQALLPELLKPSGATSPQALPPRTVPLPSPPETDARTVIGRTEDFLATQPAPVATPVAPVPAPTPGRIDPALFRSYDIRGVVGASLSPDAVRLIGLAFGAEAGARGQQTVVVARDGRASSPVLRDALVAGLQAAGRDVLDIGLAPSPVLYFATHYLATRTGVMVTGSHNPPEYNGLKLVLDGETLAGEAIQAIRARIEKGAWTEGQTGQYQTVEILADYIRRVSEDIPVCLGKPLRIVVDAGNAVPGRVAPDVLRALGHDVIELFCEPDAEFPNHHPDPSQPENLADLIAMVKHERADIGFAFDGDGDRLGVVDSAGAILWPDRQLMLFAREILARHPRSSIVFDVKCSHLLARFVRELGGEPVMARSGHSLIKQRMQQEGALLAGDLSGHLFFKDRWYGFDDAVYAAARMAEILTAHGTPSAELFASLPAAHSTPELRLPMPEAAHAAFMQRLRAALDFPDGALTDIDGIRVDFARGWGLIRPSNTTPCLTLRFEGEDEAALKDVQQRFRTLLLRVEPSLNLPF